MWSSSTWRRIRAWPRNSRRSPTPQQAMVPASCGQCGRRRVASSRSTRHRQPRSGHALASLSSTYEMDEKPSAVKTCLASDRAYAVRQCHHRVRFVEIDQSVYVTGVEPLDHHSTEIIGLGRSLTCCSCIHEAMVSRGADSSDASSAVAARASRPHGRPRCSGARAGRVLPGIGERLVVRSCRSPFSMIMNTFPVHSLKSVHDHGRPRRAGPGCARCSFPSPPSPPGSKRGTSRRASRHSARAPGLVSGSSRRRIST